ncbi:hypothetical protein SCAR479_02549 [Seiridium cardinale]|uniref:RNase III domain-containing protein n=1 Tax=Seiridium cardinale TaxID=138064 RepID=A0ABR2Y3G5_9PEZI
MSLNVSCTARRLASQSLRSCRSSQSGITSSLRPLVSTSSFSTSPSRSQEYAAAVPPPEDDAPRWARTPERMKAPFSQHITKNPKNSVWSVNTDPAKLDDALNNLLGKGGERLLPDELKWLAVTHKSFDQGRRGFNDRLAYLGRQIALTEAMQSILSETAGPLGEQTMDKDPFEGRREPFENAMLEKADRLTFQLPNSIFNLKNMQKLAVETGISEVVRWKPRQTESLRASGISVVMSGALYAIVGAVALQHGGKAASRVGWKVRMAIATDAFQQMSNKHARFEAVGIFLQGHSIANYFVSIILTKQRIRMGDDYDKLLNIINKMEHTQQRRTHRPLVLRLRLPWLLIVPVLLAVLAIVMLVLHSDYNIPALYSQCRAHSRLHSLSRIPVIGPPSCFLISFFQFANASARSFARMSVILSFVSALLATNLVESARLCNKPSRVISKPTIPWLVFNLIGGVLVWDLVIVPSFLRRAKDIQAARESSRGERMREANSDLDREVRCLSSQVEVWAIPAAVVIGFVVPSLVMLIVNDPVSIAVWLFFPLWVAAIRYVVKVVGVNSVTDPEPYDLEARKWQLVGVYAVPVLCSVLAHGLLIWNLFSHDDRKEMTRATIRFIQIDVVIIGLTVLYWILVEAGVIVTLAFIGLSILLGPGAGLSAAWVLREKAIDNYTDGTEGHEDDVEGTVNNEQTPLLS